MTQGRIPDVSLLGKLKALATTCDPESHEEVIVALKFEAIREVDEAREYLGLGATVKGQTMDVVFTAGGGDEFRRTVRAACLSGMAAKTGKDDSSLITLTWAIETRATLEEMFSLYGDFLEMRGAMLLALGVLRQRALPLGEVTVTVKRGAA